jgi:pyruvate/2-oxoglutarate dehydrogenase complex dihydrolipoamide dehydrogenase (E3) component
MSERLRPDICVIGAGSGGLSVAAAAAAFGVPVVLVEKGRMGGDCLNAGCVPSKSLIAAARHAHALALAPKFGIAAAAAETDFKGVHRHIHEVIAAIAPNDSRERFAALGVRVIEGVARFKSRRTLMVGEDLEVRARRFVVATGSSPIIPPIPGLDAVPYLTNETVFDLTTAPQHLIVIGGGPVGLELAQAFRRLGSAVTVLEAALPLAHEDAECVAAVLRALRREGVDIRSPAEVLRIEPADPARPGGMLQVTLRSGEREDTVAGSHLLIAAGRRANVEGLGLEEARIAVERGSIVVDRGLRTTNRRVYAVGDVIGGLQLTHAANYHAGLVIRNALFRLRVRVDEDTIPRVTFTDPELAHTGLSEATARERGLRINVLRWPYHENDRARIERATAGHIKVITSPRGKVLGCTIVGAQAGELITAWTLAVRHGLDARSIAGITVPYPTLSEVGKRAATTYFLPGLTSKWTRRMVGLLRRFG